MIRNIVRFFIFIITLISSPIVTAQLQIQDDDGQLVDLEKPAQRIIALSPGITELIFAAGGSDYIKGVVSFSNYPERAKSLPQVGRYDSLDLEKILSLHPDLIVAWKSGNPRHQIQQLKKLGLKVFISEPRDFMDIPKTITQLGYLMDTINIAEKNAKKFTRDFKYLEKTYSHAQPSMPKTTFIQIWNNPVMSVNQEHLISKVISLCGGKNIFADIKGLTHTPSIENILQENPDIIIATGMAETAETWLNRWQQWPYLTAVKKKQLYAVNPDHLVRHTPRILLGIKEVCQLINN